MTEVNRRRHIRVSPNPREPIRVNINGENFLDILNAVDISESGIGLKVPHLFNGCVLESVSFLIDLPIDSKAVAVQVRGNILHISGQQFGVEFSRMPHVESEKIKRYISEKIRKESMVDWLKYKVGLMV